MKKNSNFLLNFKKSLTIPNITKFFCLNIEAKKAIGLIHKVYLSILKSARKYTAHTKTKKEVRGGGRKPWKQKGTGRARAGSSRSPLWVGGGISFGPRTRKVFKKINKKEKQLAIAAAFYLKKNKIKIISNLFFKNCSVKTKELATKLNIFKEFTQKKNILIVTDIHKNSLLSLKNLKNVKLCSKKNLNLNLILNSSLILFSVSNFY